MSHPYADNPDLPPIPETLDEAVDQIIVTMSDEDKAAAHQENPEHPYGAQHHWGGMAMRNAWGLWFNDTPIAQWFRDHGVLHADDRSAIVYKALYCRLTGAPFSIEREAGYYQQWWADRGCNPDGSPLEGAS